MVTNSLLAGKWKTKLLAIEHSGRLRHHRHTSYGSLLLVLALAWVPIVALQSKAAAGGSPGLPPVQSSYGVYAVVPHAPPTTPQVISPANGHTVTTDETLNVTGSCSNNNTVYIYKNTVLAGTAPCHSGAFSVPIDLFMGANTLFARAYNLDGMPSPDSVSIQVALRPATPQLGVGSIDSSSTTSTTATSINQFYVTSDQTYRAGSPGDAISWPVTLIGGHGPYTVHVEWGDGHSQNLTEQNAGTFTISHSYAKPAGANNQYKINITADDAQGMHSLAQLAALVPVANKSVSNTGSTPLSWPIFIITIITAIIGAFWIGEKRELLHLHRARLA